MSSDLFKDFNSVNETAWKQKIQVDLKGADYNDTLLWHTDEGISVKPFYTKTDRNHQKINLPKNSFNICQSIFVDDEKIANNLALDSLKRGANSIQFVANKEFDFKSLLQNIRVKETIIYFKINFLNADFIKKVSSFSNSENIYFQIDIIGNLAETGNWFYSLKKDQEQIKEIFSLPNNSVSVDVTLYQNAGATIVQQLAYALAHANEYLTIYGGSVTQKLNFQFSVGSNYFFEIAKLRAFRILWDSLLKEYNLPKIKAHIFTQPSLRNKTLYDYNVNLLRTSSESMSAILGSADTVSNISYDSIYHKSNEFGERISRNQLLILKEESELSNAQNFADGTYYIESITSQLAEKALNIFKLIENAGGFLKQLKEGIIQRKITESANKEQEKFSTKEITLLGTNILSNEKDKMKENLELYPFVKSRKEKTLIPPIIKKRLAENLEKERLNSE